ncbi:N-acetylmuramoyl-L-alanine amidase [Alicyclobacillus curvatus]|jgi:N-acetylmuramoyl-L-alanine amidase|nr:N-acetylmuramoyl-L-alanine amidase [Alicyclobacillus curvatus]
MRRRTQSRQAGGTIWQVITITLSVLCAFVLLVSGRPGQASAQTGTGGGEPGFVGKTIVIDPGHGSPDSGARSSSGLMEKDITLPVSLKLVELLREAGANVILTRTTDADLASERDTKAGRRQSTDLRNRVIIAKARHCDAFVSVHCNAVPSERWMGAQVLYQHDNMDGERLAKMMQRRFDELLLPTDREAADSSTLYLLKRIPGPAVIAEIGFLSSPKESAHLVSPAYQQKIALAMYLSLHEYFSSQRPADLVPQSDLSALTS